jgi:hypothetical protein
MSVNKGLANLREIFIFRSFLGSFFLEKRNFGEQMRYLNSSSLSLPQLNRLVEASFVRDESSASNADATAIPSQLKVTKQILLH